MGRYFTPDTVESPETKAGHERNKILRQNFENVFHSFFTYWHIDHVCQVS